MSEIHLPRFARVPGLLVTATDTEVGKTVVTCAILKALHVAGVDKAAGFKPFASGCRREAGALVNDDSLALQACSGLPLSLDEICPVRYVLPVAPGVAAEAAGEPPDEAWHRMHNARMHLTDKAGCLIIEGVGGLLAPVDQLRTVLDLATTLQFPAVVVARSTLGTLNHTAMTVKLLREAGCRVAGVVMNGFDTSAMTSDPSIATNRRWIEKMTGTEVLVVLPRVEPDAIDLSAGLLPEAIMKPMREVDWASIIAPPRSLLL